MLQCKRCCVPRCLTAYCYQKAGYVCPVVFQAEFRLMSVHIEIYTWPHCPYCHRAKALLDAKGVAYTEIDVLDNTAKRAEMEQRSGRRTVPQIFIGGTHVGGCDDLHALDEKGGLDPMLAQAS